MAESESPYHKTIEAGNQSCAFPFTNTESEKIESIP